MAKPKPARQSEGIKTARLKQSQQPPRTNSATAGQLTNQFDVARQVERLSDPRLSSIQRQAIAANINRVGGNQQLQRVMSQVSGTTPVGVQRSWLDDAAEWVGDQAESGTEWVEETAEGAADWAGEKAQGAADWVEEKATDAGEALEDGAEWVGEKAEGAADWAGEKVEDAADWAGEKAEGAADWVEEKADAAQEWVEEGAEDLQDWGEEKWAEIEEAAAGASDWLEEQAEDFGEWLDEKTSDIADWAQETYDDVTETVDDLIEGGKTALDKLGQAIDDMVEGVKDAFLGEGGPVSEDDTKRFEKIQAILETIPGGQDALATMKKYRIGVTYKAGVGSFYDPETNTMVLDTAENPETSALTFVHEINHGKYHNEGLDPDATTVTRDEYIKARVEEEAEGAVLSIEAKMELEGTTVDVSKATFPQEQEYRQAYNDAIAAAKAKDPAASKEDLNKIGRAAGKKRVVKGFYDGEVVTSTKPPTPYPEFYGKDWDNQNGVVTK
ncbi:MAG: hypothetical protein KDE59_07870 [Anaerolineales bacterium]|nr:hypothetical protein [Anaerolineales bacterium]